MEVNLDIDYMELSSKLKIRCNMCDGTGKIVKFHRERYYDEKGKRKFKDVKDEKFCDGYGCHGKGWYSDPAAYSWALAVKKAMDFLENPDKVETKVIDPYAY